MCEEDLRNAEPMLVAAKQALNILNKVSEIINKIIFQKPTFHLPRINFSEQSNRIEVFR